MVSFRVETEVRAPLPFVVDWWWDFSSEDPAITPRMVRREVQRIDDRTVRLTTQTEFGGSIRSTAGTVTRTGPASWHMTGHVSSGGVVVSTLQTSYSVESTAEGSRVTADFEFHGRTLPWRIVLGLSRYTLRRDRARIFRGYAEAIEADFEAERSSWSSGTSTPAPPSQTFPPA